MRAVYSTQEEIPEAMREEYTELDGRFVLKVEGDHPTLVSAEDLNSMKAKVTELRDKNIAIMKSAAEIAGVSEVSDDLSQIKIKMAAMSNVDPKEHEKLLVKLKQFEEQSKDKPDIAGIVKQQVEEAVGPLQKRVEEAETREAAALQKVNRATLREAISAQASKKGARADALGFILDKAEEQFEVKNDQVVAKTGVFSKDKPSDPLGVDEWMASAVKQYGFAFEPSQGGDTPTGSGEGGPTPPLKPGVMRLVNPTPAQLGEHAKAIREGKAVIVDG